MLTFDLTPLAKRLGCLPQLEAASGKDLSRVGWRFLGAILREMPVPDADAQAVVDPVIAGMDHLAKGEDWPKAAAWAAADAAAAAAEARAAAAKGAWVARPAALAAEWAATARAADAGSAASLASWYANFAGLTYARQREMLLEMMKEATE